MTDRELMQQALDAMLNFPNDISDEMFESIRVLRARLAQPEQQWQSTADKCELEPVPAKGTLLPEQEPVAWMHDSQVGFNVPLYTAPPQRSWQGLTDDEIVEIAATPAAIPGAYVHCFARDIEAKLKEKNHG